MRTFKRIVAFVLVLALLLTMPGCGQTPNGDPLIIWLIKGAIRCVSLVVVGLSMYGICLLFNLDEDSLIVDKMGRWIREMDQRMVDHLNGVEHVPLETEQVEMDIFYADDEGAGNTEPTQAVEEEEKGWLASAWDAVVGIFVCQHQPWYDSKAVSIVCRCGEVNLDDLPSREMPVEKFQHYVRRDGRDDTEQFAYVMQQFRRYYGIRHGMPEDKLDLVLSLNCIGVSNENFEDLDVITKFIQDTSAKIQDTGEVVEDFAVVFGKDGVEEAVEAIGEYLGTMDTIVMAVKLGTGMAQIDWLYENGGSKEAIVHQTIEFLKDSTSLLPIGGEGFGQVLDGVEEGIQIVLKNVEALEMWREASSRNGLQTVFAEFGSWTNREGWKQGPELADLWKADLTAEELAIIFPYIEFRINYELEQIYGGVTLDDILAVRE